jgi:hypothetical protein
VPLSAGSQREYDEGRDQFAYGRNPPFRGDRASAERVGRSALALAVWALETGTEPTWDVECAIADVIRHSPARHDLWRHGPPDEVADITRWGCEAWVALGAPSWETIVVPSVVPRPGPSAAITGAQQGWLRRWLWF